MRTIIPSMKINMIYLMLFSFAHLAAGDLVPVAPGAGSSSAPVVAGGSIIYCTSFGGEQGEGVCCREGEDFAEYMERLLDDAAQEEASLREIITPSLNCEEAKRRRELELKRERLHAGNDMNAVDQLAVSVFEFSELLREIRGEEPPVYSEECFREDAIALPAQAFQQLTECDLNAINNNVSIAALMESPDLCSVALLKALLPASGFTQVLDTFAHISDVRNMGVWAKDLSPELVVAKAEIAYPPARGFANEISESVRGTSEGELAFKEYLKKHERGRASFGFHPFRHTPLPCAFL